MNLLLSLFIMGCGHHDDHTDHAADVAARVAWATPLATETVPVTTLPAEAVSAPSAAWHLAPPTTGRLTRWLVEPGEVVEPGQPVATLTSPALADLTGAVAAAEATLRRRSAAADAARSAASQGVGSATERQDAEAAATEARAVLEGLKARLAATRDTTRPEDGSWTWDSPEAGVVQALTCPLGPVEPDKPCLHLVDPNQARVRVQVPERYVATLGERVSGTFTSEDGTASALTLHTAAPALDSHTRSRELHFLADPPPRLGASGRALLTVPAAPGTVAVPRVALTRLQGRPAVILRRGELGEPMAVEQVGQDPERVWLRNLPPDAEIAVEGVFLLKSLALLDEDASGHDH